MTDDGNGRISYTTKELLAQINHKLDGLDIKLDSKADTIRVDELTRRVNELETGLSDLVRQVKTQNEINAALAKRTAEAKEESVHILSRRETLALVLIAGMSFVVETVVQLLGVHL